MAVGTANSKQFEQWYGTSPHPMLEAHFSPAEVDALFQEDLSAGRNVPLILTSVIFGGMLLAILSVLLCW